MIKKVNLEFSEKEVLLPSVNHFVDLIDNDIPFHFIRANHGVWDWFHFAYEGRINELDALLNQKEYFTIAKEVASFHTNSEFYKDREGIKFWHGNSKTIINKLYYFIKTFCEYKNISDKIMIGLSLGVGLHDKWGIYHAEHPIQIGRKNIVDTFMLNSKFNFYYSGILKHYCVMQELDLLFNKLNELDFNIIFLGPEYFSNIPNVYSINNFEHIQIPIKEASDKFDTYIGYIKSISSNGKKTIVFHSCGHDLSFYMAYMLKDTKVFGIDIGKSFDLDLKDYVEEERKNGKYDWFNVEWIHNPYEYYGNYINNLRNG
jgi:hypothetical protein